MSNKVYFITYKTNDGEFGVVGLDVKNKELNAYLKKIDLTKRIKEEDFEGDNRYYVFKDRALLEKVELLLYEKFDNIDFNIEEVEYDE